MDRASHIAEEAELFLDAQRNGRTLDLLTMRWPDADLAVAEKIAAATVALSGEAVVGIKLGFTGSAMRDQMNIAAPNFGWLTQAMDLTDTAMRRSFVHPRVEPEVAVILAKAIGGSPLSPSEALPVIDSVHSALEIVDTRFHDYRFTLVDNTADNSSAAGFVLGPAHRPKGLIEQSLLVTLLQDGNPVAQGASSDAMGGPLDAVAWLSAALFERGLVLPAGAIILTGGLTAAPYLRVGEPVSAIFAGLGRVDICL